MLFIFILSILSFHISHMIYKHILFVKYLDLCSIQQPLAACDYRAPEMQCVGTEMCCTCKCTLDFGDLV